MKRTLLLAAMAMTLLATAVLTACGSDDDADINDYIVGTWAWNVKFDKEVNFDLYYEDVIFYADGTCWLTYEDVPGVVEHMEGRYEAGNDYIRIVSDELENGFVLWQVVSFSATTIQGTYTDKLGAQGENVTATVTLTKK